MIYTKKLFKFEEKVKTNFFFHRDFKTIKKNIAKKTLYQQICIQTIKKIPLKLNIEFIVHMLSKY